MYRTLFLFVVIIGLILINVIILPAKNNSINHLLSPCTQKLCAVDTGGNYLSGMTIQVDSAGVVIDTCNTGFTGCCDITLNSGVEYNAIVLQSHSESPHIFTACTPKPIKITVR